MELEATTLMQRRFEGDISYVQLSIAEARDGGLYVHVLHETCSRPLLPKEHQPRRRQLTSFRIHQKGSLVALQHRQRVPLCERLFGPFRRPQVGEQSTSLQMQRPKPPAVQYIDLEDARLEMKGMSSEDNSLKCPHDDW